MINLSLRIVLACFFIASCNKKLQKLDSVKVETPKIIYSGPPKIQFDSTHYHIGSIKQGEIKNFELNFINAGGEALEIKLISACECTTVDWPVLPIASGVQKKLKISYNSKDKKGLQIVDLDIMTNMPEERVFIKFELLVE